MSTHSPPPRSEVGPHSCDEPGQDPRQLGSSSIVPHRVVPLIGATHAFPHPPQLFKSAEPLTHSEPHLSKPSKQRQPHIPSGVHVAIALSGGLGHGVLQSPQWRGSVKSRQSPPPLFSFALHKDSSPGHCPVQWLLLQSTFPCVGATHAWKQAPQLPRSFVRFKQLPPPFGAFAPHKVLVLSLQEPMQSPSQVVSPPFGAWHATPQAPQFSWSVFGSPQTYRPSVLFKQAVKLGSVHL